MAEAPVRRGPQSAPGIFITGTDTGIGKTYVACALLHALCRTGMRAVGMKPVAAGASTAEHGVANDDALALNRASAFESDMSLVNPYCFADPIAPHLAARDAGVDVDLDRIRDCYRRLGRAGDFVVVEGAGGFLVPLGPGLAFADLALALGLPTVLVVGMRLGCLNHAMLTAEAIERRGLPFAGWVANRIDPDMQRWEDNLEALRARLPSALLGVIPHAENSADAASAIPDASPYLAAVASAFAAM